MKKRLFLYTTLIVLAGLLCFFAVSIAITYYNNLRLAKDSVMETAQIYADIYAGTANPNLLVKTGDDTYITLISRDGLVLSDDRSLDIGTMENHLNRPEIQAAMNNHPAAYLRHSDTLGVDLIYYAVKVDSPGGEYAFVRAAVPVAKIDAYLWQSLPLLMLILCIVVLLCFFLSRSMAVRITKPVQTIEQRLRLLLSGAYTPAPVAGGYEEIDAILGGIDEAAQLLQNSLTALCDEKNKAEYILNNIGDGIFAVDATRAVTLINNAALTLFGVAPDIAGKDLNYLSYEKALAAAVDDCIAYEKNTLFELALNGKTYLVTVKRLRGTAMTMVVLSDITDSRESAKQREEFFANASHELKTPLTAIKGFNELTALNNKDEGIRKYIGSITRETDRMLSLIGDMLALSALENTQGLHPVPMSLAAVVSEARETLSAAISEKSITLELIGDGMVEAEPGHVYELVKNIVENAVRYSNHGGRVSVTIENDRKNTWLFVFDDGIGILPEEQTRIFERFYRVEKSRSQSSGGTGLGLSIVKHICALYGWRLSLKSKLGVGTEVAVAFGSER